MIKKLYCANEYFSPQATLECGQTFRFWQEDGGYFICSGERACRLRQDGKRNEIVCREEDAEYFRAYFDLDRNYGQIVDWAKAMPEDCIRRAAESGRGIRILNQDAEEMILTFILSQNNNIPRIRSMVAKVCERAGEERELEGRAYRTFPRAEKLAALTQSEYISMGFGYRAAYFREAAYRLAKEDIRALKVLPTVQLREQLMTYKGIGEKVADCILLFGFGRTDAFPVDVWMERVYRECFGGRERSRRKIAQAMQSRFGRYSGYIQQYLFYFEREGSEKNGADHDQ